MCDTSRHKTNLLTIGYVSSLHYQLVPFTIAAFHECYPEVALNLLDMNPASQLKALEARTIDLALLGLHNSLTSHDLDGQPVTPYRIMVALSTNHPMSRRSKLTLEDLNGDTLLTMSKDTYPGWQEAIDHHIVGRQSRAGVQEIDGVLAIMALVASGAGIALLPEQVRRLPHHGVVFRALTPAIKVWAWIVWRRDNTSEPLRRCLQVLRRESGWKVLRATRGSRSS